MKSLLYISILLLTACSLSAQQVIKGIVTDAGNGRPVDAAAVQIRKAGRQFPLTYTLTKADGTFTLSLHQTDDSLSVHVSLLGYKAVRQKITNGATLHIRLEPEVFTLKEVEIRPGRVYGRQDTINYDVSQFISPKDEAIKDVLKKLPGVDVDDDGKISYNGKNISQFYVEGMDLTDGRYNQLTNNLQADAVKSVQVLENHQPIRALQKKLTTEDIAINLKLKDNFRDRWMGTLEGGLGASPLLWEGTGNAIQISRNSQSAYIYKGNNRGNDVTDEQNVLTQTGAEKGTGPSIPSFLSQPSFSAPLKKERLLFNNVHSLSGNRVYKLDETTQLRLNTNYLHDLTQQERGSVIHYYQAGDTATLAEQSSTHIRTDRAEVAMSLENNAESHYLTNDFNLSGNWERGTSRISGASSVNQRIRTPDMGIRNYLQNIRTRDRYTLELRSLLRYHNLPARILIDGDKQTLNLQQLYLDHSLAFLRKKRSLTRQYTVGITGDLNSIRNGTSLYFKPNYQWNLHKWNLTFHLPLVWTTFPAAGFSRLAANPFLYINYKFNYAWRFSIHANYHENYGNITDLYPDAYRTDHRHYRMNNGILPVNRTQSYSLYGEYKNTVREFFATLSLNHNRGWSDRIFEQQIQDGQVALVSHRLSNHSSGWTVKGTLSKGFYDYGLKTSLTYLLGRSEAEQLSAGERLPYRYDFMQYEPKIIWTPVRCFSASYQATIHLGRSSIGTDTRLDPLLNIVRKLQLSYELFPIEINLSADHYHNDVSRGKAVNAFFADLSFRWKTGNWQFVAEATNLFNKRQYSYTQYSATESYTSWIDIRPREFRASVRYKF
ncbi:carboxypeptidase-like regulatory domain-containing protein [uncultured Parabacteroides sp.]|uniref:carboxypeptidase regulatory-like domain-containing protein n=1 Tax=uncultured Parabacteroides sp. TaxID=512312 RepID=UPI002630893B|nr:carboxypeptidase-like regulatory domain-containing protein [uncultured Parabacteroides sp.]